MIEGFSFYDKDDKLLYTVGNSGKFYLRDTVIIAENEIIVGVVTTLRPGFNTGFSNF
jgi:hypothetical protein